MNQPAVEVEVAPAGPADSDLLCLIRSGQDWRKASRSLLIVSAWVVGIP